MTRIQANEVIGHRIEELAVQEFKGVLSERRRVPFDIETDSSLIEVKSCRMKTRGHKTKDGSVYMQTGRFAVFDSSHQRLLEEAELRGKKPCYLFVIYENKLKVKIVRKKKVSYAAVSKILEKRKLYKRKDGLKLRIFPHTMVFQQRALT